MRTPPSSSTLVVKIVLRSWRDDPDLVRLLVREVTRNPHIQDELDEIGQAFAMLERMVRRGQDDGTFRADLDPKLASWMLYGALEEVLTGWVLGQLPDDAARGQRRRARGDRDDDRRAARMTIDPLARWRPLPDKPDYAGFLSFGGAPIAQEPEHLAGVDVAIVGAPMDDLVSDRPGTRFAPRAIRAASCPPGPHLEAGVDAFAELRIVDYGDAPVHPGRSGALARGDRPHRRRGGRRRRRCR